MNKDAVKSEISLASPLSPSALFQFLSAQQGESGLKIREPFTKPVLKVRPKSQPISDEQRKAWAFHLGEMHQRQVGSAEAEKARASIDSLMKKEALKASVRTFMEPVVELMAAEQARLGKASSCVRRWLANERLVQELVTTTDDKNALPTKILDEKNALAFACRTLEKFKDSENGEIDLNGIRDQAYGIGHALTQDDLKQLHLARFLLLAHKDKLSDYIGPELPLLIELCIYAVGRTEEDYRTDAYAKSLCLNITKVLCARTDNEAYPIPQSPRTVAHRTGPHATLPVFADASDSNTSSARTVPEKGRADDILQRTGNDSSMTERSPEAARSLASSQGQPSPVSPYSPRARVPGLGERLLTAPASAAVMVEMQDRQRQKLTHSSTVNDSARARQDQDGHQHKSLNNEKRKLRRSMQYDAPPLEDADDDRIAREAQEPGEGMKKPNREFKERRKAQKTQRLSQPVGKELKALQQQPAASLKSQMEAGMDVNAAQQAIPDARVDNPLADKWDALESRLGSRFHAEGRAVVNKLLPHWKGVNLTKLDKTVFSSLVLTAGMSRKDRIALIDLRDALLADSLKGPQSVAAAVFPELLALVIHSIDAQRNLSKAKN